MTHVPNQQPDQPAGTAGAGDPAERDEPPGQPEPPGRSASDEPSPDTAGDESQLDAASAAGFGGVTWADDMPPAGGDRPDAAGDEPGDPSDHDPTSAGQPGVAGDAGELSIEQLVGDLERVARERDEFLDASRRLQADFENYRKAVAKREIDSQQRANESLVTALLPVLDGCDGALASGASDVEPIRTSLLDVLEKQGLGRIDDTGKPFDPVHHDAVMHEPAAEGAEGDGPVVAEVMRAGYTWKGRVVRPAMVRVRG